VQISNSLYLVKFLLGVQEVPGSNPGGPTNYFQLFTLGSIRRHRAICVHFFPGSHLRPCGRSAK